MVRGHEIKVVAVAGVQGHEVVHRLTGWQLERPLVGQGHVRQEGELWIRRRGKGQKVVFQLNWTPKFSEFSINHSINTMTLTSGYRLKLACSLSIPTRSPTLSVTCCDKHATPIYLMHVQFEKLEKKPHFFSIYIQLDKWKGYSGKGKLEWLIIWEVSA